MLTYSESRKNNSGVSRSHFLDYDIENCLSAIEERTRSFYRDCKEEFSEEFVENKVLENKNSVIRMIVYDCLYGNNDRHDENWALVKDYQKNDISLYPLYDNERVLGLYENQEVIEEALRKNKVVEVSDKKLFSRIKVPGERESFSNYREVLKYMIKHYPEETSEAIKDNLEGNTSEKIENYLESCEGLPKCYVEFAIQMYLSRYEFAKELLTKSKIQTNNVEPQRNFTIEEL